MDVLRRPELFAAVRWLVAGLALVCACPADAGAQGPATGAVHGVAVDAGGATLRDVAVRAVERETGEERSGRTLRDGSFLLAGLAPGFYTVRVGQEAGRGVVVEVAPGETAEVRFGLAAAATEVRLVREGSGPEPDENDDGLQSARGLTAQQTGAAVDGAGAVQSFGSVPVGAGAAPVTDPADDPDSSEQTTGPAHGLGRGRHAGVAYAYAQGSVREFRVGASTYSAEASGAGGVLTRTTRAGGERWHGAAFFDLQSSALAAKEPLAIASSFSVVGNDGVVTAGEVKPHDLREGLGGVAGGPVPARYAGVRGLRFLDAVEIERRGFPAISSPVDANFYALTAEQAALLAGRGVTRQQTNAALNYLSSLTGETPRRSDEAINFARLDWRARPRLALGAEYNLVRWHAPAGLIDAPVVARGRASLGNAAGSLDQALVRVAPEWSGRTTAELRVGFTRDLQYETPQTPLAQEPAIGPGGLSPEVNIGPDGILFGTPASLSQKAYPDEQRVEVDGRLTMVRGHHALEFGGTFAYVQERVATQGNVAGTFRYDSGTTGGYDGGLVDWISDYIDGAHALPEGACPSIAASTHYECFRSFTQSFGEQEVRFSTEEWAGFAEETWRPGGTRSRRLAVHAGLRYEFQLLPRPQQPNPELDVLFGTRGATNAFPEDRNNAGPRVALTWAPFGEGRGVVRAGYGAYFGRVPGATIQAALSDTAEAGATTRIRIRPTTVTSCPQVPAVGFGYGCDYRTEPGGVAAQTTSAVVFGRDFRLPVVQQASVGVERRIGRGTNLSLEYVMNADRQLPGSTDLNIAPATSRGSYQLQGGTGQPGVKDGEVFSVPLYTLRVSPEFGPVTEVVSHGNATYEGLVARGETHVRELLVAGEFTWSKAIDFGQDASATPRTDSQFDPFADGYDKGVSSLNYPYVLRARGVWTPGGERVRRGVRRVAQGWTVAALETARSGRPYTLDVSGGPSLAGGHESLNGSGGAQYLPTVGRNTLRLPAVVKTDLRVAKGFALGAGLRGEAAAEATNLLNHESVSSVNQRAFLVGTEVNGVTPLVFQSASAIAAEGLNTTAFGTPDSAGSSESRERQVRFSLRISF